MSEDPLVNVNKFKENHKDETEVLVKTVFPKKILEMNELIESDLFQYTSLPSIRHDINMTIPEPVMLNSAEVEPQKKKRKLECADTKISGSLVYSFPEGQLTCNKTLFKMIDLVKPEIRELIEYTNKIKMWIAFLIPRIEDGNNFGVSIQEDIMAEARQVESEAATYLDQITRYFLTRAKIITKVAKYPHVEDYRRTVFELDEKQFLSNRLVCIELRNHYSSLHDVIHKNLEKIKKPRSSNTDNMY